MIGRRDRTGVRATLAVLTACSLLLGACGSSDDAETDAGQSGDSSTTSTAESTSTSTDDTTTTSEADSSTAETEPATSTEGADDGDVATDADATKSDVPAPGTGTLTIDGVEIALTIKECDYDPEPSPLTSARATFAMNASAEVDGRMVNVNASRIELAGRISDTYSYGYIEDPDDFETAVIVGTGGNTGEQFMIDGTTYSAGPLPFERIEGVSVVEGVDPGPGSIIFTC